MAKRLTFQLLTLIFAAYFLSLLSVPVNSQELKPEIAAALKRGDTTTAIDLFKREIIDDKGYHFNYYQLGLIYFNLGQNESAREMFETALDKKSKHLESMYYLGMSCLRLGDLKTARALMEKGRKKAKKEKKAIFDNGFGLVMLALKDYQEADRAFRSALVVDSENAEYHINLGDANFFQGIPSLAIIEYKKALKHDTASLEVFYHWAEACLEMRDYNCAIEKLKVVLSRDSTHANAWMRAGGIYFKAALSSRNREDRKARFIETIGSYKKYLELSGTKPDSSQVRTYFELAMSYVNIFGFEDAVKYFEDVLNIPYEPRDIYFNYGKSLWGIKDYPRSGEALLEHIEWEKKQDEDYTSKISRSELYRLLGDSYYYRKPEQDFASATKYYKMSLKEDPDQKRIVYNVAVAYHSLKSYSQAVEYYELRFAMGIDSTYAAIYKNAGYCALNIANNEADGDDMELDDEELSDETAIEVNYFEKAIEYMISYLEFHPNDEKVLLLVASTYLYQLLDCSKGVMYYERLLAVDTDNCEAKKAIGYAYFGGLCDKNYSRALTFLRKAYQCKSAADGKCGDPDLLLWVGQCYHLRAADKAAAKQDANDDFKNAFNWYGEVLKCDPNNVSAKKGQDDTRFEFYDKSES